ncbi:conserved hypothetical protein [Tenacibaculum sp. 190524A02b]|uniref:SnoaL-like domain-containing protein n=1 Tax=Tenacibaculum vairaonense TaxID=3137860 RepID=A0ABM9PHH2_9FLAO
MKSKKNRILVLILMTVFSSCGQKLKETVVEKTEQSYISHSPTAHHNIALEVLKASKTWTENFNKGNSEYCVNAYDETAVLSATPIGVKKGRKEIESFWKPFIASGATNLVYSNIKIEVVNENTAFLSANFSMNVVAGVIYQEKWEKKKDKWVLSYDNFQVLEQYKTPKENLTNPVASHTILENVIKESIKWTNGFNAGKGKICGNGYSENATMNAVPFQTVNGKQPIEGFWSKMIADGATNLTYHNPIFEVITDNSVTLSSLWSMNIGEGKIYQEKWENINGQWKLTYDEFQVLKQY